MHAPLPASTFTHVKITPAKGMRLPPVRQGVVRVETRAASSRGRLGQMLITSQRRAL